MMGNLLIAYVVLYIVVVLAIVIQHDIQNWKKNKEALFIFHRQYNSAGTNMPWLPSTVQSEVAPNPNWYPFYPPPVDLREKDFANELDNGVVAVYYYNCGVRKEKFITSNWRHLIQANVELVKESLAAGTGFITEENRTKAGEQRMKSIVGWSSAQQANPDYKSELANEWRANNV
jgi:hypothetical protein